MHVSGLGLVVNLVLWKVGVFHLDGVDLHRLFCGLILFVGHHSAYLFLDGVVLFGHFLHHFLFLLLHLFNRS